MTVAAFVIAGWCAGALLYAAFAVTGPARSRRHLRRHRRT